MEFKTVKFGVGFTLPDSMMTWEERPPFMVRLKYALRFRKAPACVHSLLGHMDAARDRLYKDELKVLFNGFGETK
jgi:hypothetical protein